MIVRMMAVVCAVALFTADIVAAEPTTPPPQRSLTAIRTDVGDALRAEATTRRSGDNTQQVLRLVDLYLEMASHLKRDTSPLLNDLGQQVRLRLQTVRDRVKQRVAQKEAAEKKNARPATVAVKKEDHVLAQQGPPAGGQAGGAQAAAAGQGMAVAVAPTAAARPTDFGPELVELLEATISPATWRINGGNGVIVYYTPLHVLVVSAPDDVHAQVGSALQQLHATQRQQDGTQVVSGVDLGRVQQ